MDLSHETETHDDLSIPQHLNMCRSILNIVNKLWVSLVEQQIPPEFGFSSAPLLHCPGMKSTSVFDPLPFFALCLRGGSPKSGPANRQEENVTVDENLETDF